MKKIKRYVSPKNAGITLVKELQKMKNVEDLGTSIYHTNQQFYFILQNILLMMFKFKEEDLKKLNKELTHALEGLAWFEEKGLEPLSPQDVGKLVDLTMHKYTAFKARRAGLELPSSSEAKKILDKK